MSSTKSARTPAAESPSSESDFQKYRVRILSHEDQILFDEALAGLPETVAV
jgi:hypothetical protein